MLPVRAHALVLQPALICVGVFMCGSGARSVGIVSSVERFYMISCRRARNIRHAVSCAGSVDEHLPVVWGTLALGVCIYT